MAVINITVTPQFGPNGSPMQFRTDDNTRYAPVKLTIPSGQTYAQADQMALVHTAGSSFFDHFGARIIKQVLAEPIACTDISYGILCPQWGFLVQKLRLTRAGNGGATAPTGPQTEAQVVDGTALGTNTMTCNAIIFW